MSDGMMRHPACVGLSAGLLLNDTHGSCRGRAARCGATPPVPYSTLVTRPFSFWVFTRFFYAAGTWRPKAAVRRTRGEVVAVMAVLPNRWLVFDVGLVLLIIYYAFPASATSGTAAVERRSTGLVTDAAPVSAPAWSLQDPRKSDEAGVQGVSDDDSQPQVQKEGKGGRRRRGKGGRRGGGGGRRGGGRASGGDSAGDGGMINASDGSSGTTGGGGDITDGGGGGGGGGSGRRRRGGGKSFTNLGMPSCGAALAEYKCPASPRRALVTLSTGSRSHFGVTKVSMLAYARRTGADPRLSPRHTPPGTEERGRKRAISRRRLPRGRLAAAPCAGGVQRVGAGGRLVALRQAADAAPLPRRVRPGPLHRRRRPAVALRARLVRPGGLHEADPCLGPL